MQRREVRPLLLLSIAVACSSPTAPDATGAWGGTEASLVLARSGGTINYPCGAGVIDSAWTITRDGHFAATGRHYFGGGPLPPQGHPPQPATYAGQLRGQYFILTVTLTDLSQMLGPFRLVRDGPVVAEQCV
jgi:hypothetical protein